MQVVLFNIGGINFYTFGVVIYASFILGLLVSWVAVLGFRSKTPNKFDTLLYIALVGLAGARCIYFLLNYFKFESFWQMFYFWQSGLTAYGGIIAASIFILWYVIKYEDNISTWLDSAMLGFVASFTAGSLGFRLVSTENISDFTVIYFSVILLSLVFLKFAKIRIFSGLMYIIGLVSFSLYNILSEIMQNGLNSILSNINLWFSFLVFIIVLLFVLNRFRTKPFRILIFEKSLYIKGWSKQK
ncbi:MAG: prolipoprotein diacylglyceryl transferase [bacterium]|nr:prolipoprotein diacylglyceryl transferase [bacterium]